MTSTIARSEVTEWYSKTIAPVHIGWYEPRYEGLGIILRWFDGQRWLIGPDQPETLCVFGMKGCRDQWRGLKESAC